MKTLYKASAAILMVASMSSIAIAKNLIIIKLNESKGGIGTLDTNMDLSLYKVAFPHLEPAPPAGTTGLLLINDNKPVWTTKSLKELNCIYGAKDGCFKEITLGTMPDDGNWHISMKRHNAIGCPKQLGATLATQMMKSQTKNFKFKGPFHPRQLDKALRQHKWNKIGQNSWRSIIASIGPKNGSKAMAMKVTWQLSVMSEIHMQSKAVIQMKLPKELSFLNSGGSKCVVEIDGDYKHTGS